MFSLEKMTGAAIASGQILDKKTQECHSGVFSTMITNGDIKASMFQPKTLEIEIGISKNPMRF